MGSTLGRGVDDVGRVGGGALKAPLSAPREAMHTPEIRSTRVQETEPWRILCELRWCACSVSCDVSCATPSICSSLSVLGETNLKVKSPGMEGPLAPSDPPPRTSWRQEASAGPKRCL